VRWRLHAYLHVLGSAHQEVKYPAAQGVVQTQDPELSDKLGGRYRVERALVQLLWDRAVCSAMAITSYMDLLGQ
jgi:hypothetical protein